MLGPSRMEKRWDVKSGSQKQSYSEGPGGWQASWGFHGDLSQSHSGPWGREDLSDLPVIGRTYLQ